MSVSESVVCFVVAFGATSGNHNYCRQDFLPSLVRRLKHRDRHRTIFGTSRSSWYDIWYIEIVMLRHLEHLESDRHGTTFGTSRSSWYGIWYIEIVKIVMVRRLEHREHYEFMMFFRMTSNT